MKHRFKKPVFRYLLEIVRDGDGDPTGKIIQDLSRQTANANVQYQLCESAIKKVEGKTFVPHVQVEKIINFICETVKKVAVYDSQTASRILDLIMSDPIIERAYGELAEALVSILDDREKAEDVLKKAFEILKLKIQIRKKRTIIFESVNNLIDKDEYYTCSTMDFIRLAYIWISIGQDKAYSKTIVDYGSQYAEGFFENCELGEFYIRFPEERYTAFNYYRRAEELASDFTEYWALCHNLTMLVKNDEWARQVMDKCRNLACSSEEFCRLGELFGNKSGLPNLALSDKYFRLAMEKATTDEEKRSVQDSIENVLEEYEQD